jgi:TRAP-type C4-dicarboxylate transport system permease small subunit
MAEKSVTQKLIDIVTGISTFMALIALFSMMILITLDVILNKTISRPIPGTIETTTYYFMVLCVFLSIPYIEKCQSHISADFIVIRFSKRTRYFYDILGKFFTIGFYSLLAYGAVIQAIKSTRRLETVMSNFTFYIWPARWGVALGILFAIFVILMILLQLLKKYPDLKS